MMDNMDPKAKEMHLATLMDLIKQMHMMDGQGLHGKPKVTSIEIEAKKLPEGEEGSPQEESQESPKEEAMEDLVKGPEAEESMESPEHQEAEEEGQGELMDKLPPGIKEMLLAKLRGK